VTSTHIPIVPPGKWRAASARATAATATKRIEGIHASAGMATTAILTSLTAAKVINWFSHLDYILLLHM
jgi:hypothetical protein